MHAAYGQVCMKNASTVPDVKPPFTGELADNATICKGLQFTFGDMQKGTEKYDSVLDRINLTCKSGDVGEPTVK